MLKEKNNDNKDTNIHYIICNYWGEYIEQIKIITLKNYNYHAHQIFFFR